MDMATNAKRVFPQPSPSFPNIASDMRQKSQFGEDGFDKVGEQSPKLVPATSEQLTGEERESEAC